MRTRVMAVMAAIFGIVLFLSGNSFALTTDELVKLKKADIPEDVILYMVDTGYGDVDRVVRLKASGFKDETILSIIKNDLKGKTETSPGAAVGVSKDEAPVKDSAAFETSRIKILWYIMYRGEPVLQNSDMIADAKMSVSGDSVKFEWEDKGGLGLLEVFLKRPFKSPFYWDINNDDMLGSGKEGFAYALQSNVDHKGKPDTDGKHYWVVYLDPKDTKVVDYIKERLSINK